MTKQQEVVLVATAVRYAASGVGRLIRERAGVSQAAVARAVEVSEPTMSRWEHGQRTPRGEPAARWAELLGELAKVS